MPRRKRARTGNLGTYSQKKARQGGGGDDVGLEGGEYASGAEQMGDLDHDEHDSWYTENMEDDDADDTAHQDVDKVSILSIMSMDEDVPTLNESSLNLFLKKAMLGMQNVVQRGKSAVAKGMKATYAVKVGQKQSGRSERREKRRKVTEYEEGLQGGNQLENWFKKRTGVNADVAEYGRDEDITTGSSRLRAIKLREESESDSESEHDDETSATLPPSTRAPSPAISSGEELELEPEPAINSSHDREYVANVQPSSDLLSPAVPNVASRAPEDVDCDEEQSENPQAPEIGVFEPPPSVADALAALKAIKLVLKPRRECGIGSKDPRIDLLLRGRLDLMKMFLWHFVDSTDGWIASSLAVAHAAERGPWLARKLREWSRAYIKDRDCLPLNEYGRWNVSLLEDEDLAQEIHLHLQGIGQYVKAMDIVHYLDTPEMKTRLKLKKTISLVTAQRWMRVMDYRWGKAPGGQYVDGHEREDVVEYRQLVFLPFWEKAGPSMRSWTKDIEDAQVYRGPGLPEPHIIVWHHDESTFYANDRRKIRWVHAGETAVPYAKGEGASLMVADFVSADYGWLRSPDGKQEARVLFKAGKAREGYFTNEDILQQASHAMDILEQHFPDDKHVLLFDNATTHQKRADDALSASKMPKFMPKEGKNWGVKTNVIGADGKPVYGLDGKLLKTTVRMADGKFADGTPQEFYYPVGHPQESIFKGMSVILQERGFANAPKLLAQCAKFKCTKGATDCCCRRILYNQPDFVNVKSNLEITCEARGFQVIFLPKFHCEINFIEQCWGYAKRVYRHFPVSSKEADLEANVLKALESVPLTSMRR